MNKEKLKKTLEFIQERELNEESKFLINSYTIKIILEALLED
ncbi:MAG: hypothetical protein WC933_02805 [Candidatus Paceibacterota bacterium]|jgi:hypothetical protein